MSLSNSLFLLLFLSLFLLPSAAKAQCPSVMGSGQPAVAFMSIYGIPHGHYFLFEQEEFKFGMSPGLQFGAIFSPGFHVQAGAELSWVNRTINREQLTGRVEQFKTMLLEVPIEMRMRFWTSQRDESQAFFTLGVGLVMSNVRESTDPAITLDEMAFHQLMLRIGFENAITIDNKFNILWGLLAKADPFTFSDETKASYLNGSYYAGAKLGIQFGF